MDRKWILALFPLVFAFLGNEVRADIFSSMTSIEYLHATEKLFISILKEYIGAMENNLEVLRRYLVKLELGYQRADKGVQDYVSNPLNAYLLIKRLTSDWDEVEALMTDKIGYDLIDKIDVVGEEENIWFPQEKDLSGAAEAITRLQSTYNLSTRSLANGQIDGAENIGGLSVSDCFEIGRRAYIVYDYEYSHDWIMEALHRYHQEVNKTVGFDVIMRDLAYTSYMMGNTERALRIIKKILETDPDNKEALRYRSIYRDKIKKSKDRLMDSESIRNMTENKAYRIHKTYEKLCRKELTLSKKESSKLTCKYVDFGRPFLKLARVKEEEANLDPRIVIYHDVIYDKEIKAIKELSTPRFRRAAVVGFKGKRNQEAPYRISKVAWLLDEENPLIAGLSRRVGHITGLDMKSSEGLQVVNYGIGGQYEAHCDYLKDGSDKIFQQLGIRNRIATFLFYMNDVTHGGATVFPEINVAVWPKKGSATLWYNILKKGVGDRRTLHAACPVLLGTKWVCNKWLHEAGQEFLRPCGLTEDEP